MSDAAKSKTKQKWAIEKPKLDNARQLRGIFFIKPEDEKFRHIKNDRRKLENPMPVAMSCKTPPAAVLGKTIPNMLVLSMPTEL